MDEFKVKVPRLKEVASQERDMSRELNSIQSELYSVKRSLRFKIAQRDRISARLTMAGNSVNEQRRKMDRLSGKLSDIARLYETTERDLCGKSAAGGRLENLIDILQRWPFSPIDIRTDFIFDVLDWLLPFDPVRPMLPGKLLPWLLPVIPGIFPPFVSNAADYFISQGSGGVGGSMGGRGDEDVEKKGTIHTKTTNDLDDKIDDWKESHGLEKKAEHKGVYDTKTGEYTEIDPKDKDAADGFDDEMDRLKMEAGIKLADAKVLTSAAWLTGELLAGDKDGTHISVTAEVGKAEAYAEAYAGLYQTDPTTGKMSFKPGIGAEIGASVTAFTAEEEAQLGNENLGVYGKVTQTVGKVGATAGVAVGLYDASGNFNPALYGGASAEAIAGEISGSAGVKVAGTDIGVTGSLNYGIGAHANVGFKDGKLSLDIGATLGVGASVKLDIDVSGTVDAVCDAGKSVWNWITGK